jgi:hypothetical protein
LPAVVVRTLTREYRLTTDSDEVAGSLAFMAIAPEIAGADLEVVNIPVEEDSGFLRLRLPDGEMVEGTAAHLLGKLHGFIFRDVSEAASTPFVHGATVIGPTGNRVLLVGHKACGKTTLVLRLLSEGFLVEGDEHVLIRENDAVARPRTLRVKAGSLPLVPELAAAIARSPFIRTWDGVVIYAVNPEIAGQPWRITAGRIDQLVFLEANHGGRSVMGPVSRDQSFRGLMAGCLMPARGVAAAAARLRRLAAETAGYRLQVGDLDGAVRHLRHVRA